MADVKQPVVALAAHEAAADSLPPSLRRQMMVGLVLRFSSVGVLVLLIILFAVAAPGFTSALSLTNILASTAVFILLSLGETFVMIAGSIDISVGSMLGLGGVAGALYMSNNYHGGNGFTTAAGSAGWNLVVVGTVISIAVGLGGGLLNGALVAFLKINSLIVTLATYGAFLGFADLLSNGVPVVNLPPASVTAGTGEVWNIPYIVFFAAGIAILLSWIAKNTRFGRYTYAVGASREAVRRSGVNVKLHTLMLFGLAGLLAGRAGMIYACHFSTASSTSGANFLLVAIAAVVIGGTPLTGGEGRIWGTVVGALIYTLLQNGFVLMNVPAFWQLPVIGLLIIVAVSLDQYQRRVRTELSAYRSLEGITAGGDGDGSKGGQRGTKLRDPDQGVLNVLLKRQT
ncbi:MAG TPA: ABC transporter permease [Acidimicrobiales bacterium]|nr:ABC transporter permease [Acidimicrobiales bacterium]